jgi:hypothetical protein
MFLAGGAVAVVACSSSSGNPANGPPSFCCNGSHDPCCESRNCGAPLTADCTAKMECDAQGGTWNYLSPPDCVFDSGAGPTPEVDAGSFNLWSDAAVDGPLGSEAGPDATPDSEPSDAGGG